MMTQNHQKEIQTRDQIRLNLWANHLQSPTAALAKALKCLEQGEGLLIWETCGGLAARKTLAGTVTSTIEPKARNSAKTTRGICDKFAKDPVGKGQGPFWSLGMPW